MNKYLGFMLMAALLTFVSGCENSKAQEATNMYNLANTVEETDERTRTGSTKPFEYLEQNNVQEVKLITTAPETEVLLTEEQIFQLIDILDKLVIYEQMEAVEVVGQTIIFEIVKMDGVIVTLENYNPWVVIDGVWYDSEYESCEEINQFANELRFY